MEKTNLCGGDLAHTRFNKLNIVGVFFDEQCALVPIFGVFVCRAIAAIRRQ